MAKHNHKTSHLKHTFINFNDNVINDRHHLLTTLTKASFETVQNNDDNDKPV